jgi:hypothetical protein
MMKLNEIRPMRLLAVACVLFTILALMPLGAAQQAAAVQDGNDSATAPVTPASISAARAVKPAATSGEELGAVAPSKPGGEGIKVHGHWVIDVKDPDGKVVQHRDFENSLVTVGSSGLASGDQLLVALFGGLVSVGDPAIAFIGNPSGDPTAFCINSITNLTCDIFYSGTNSLFSPTFTENIGLGSAALLPNATTQVSGLNTQLVFNGTDGVGSTSLPPSWVLSGNFAVPGSGRTINAVETRLPVCLSSAPSQVVVIPVGASQIGLAGSSTSLGHTAGLAPSKCDAAGYSTSQEVMPIALTYTVITNGSPSYTPTPIVATAGQIITVTVTLSFS